MRLVMFSAPGEAGAWQGDTAPVFITGIGSYIPSLGWGGPKHP